VLEKIIATKIPLFRPERGSVGFTSSIAQAATPVLNNTRLLAVLSRTEQEAVIYIAL
jgi:hypothetical protein